MQFIPKDAPAKYSATPRGKHFAVTVPVMQSNEYTIPQSKSSGRDVNYSSAPHQVSPDPAETGAADGTPRNNCLLLPCVLELFRPKRVTKQSQKQTEQLQERRKFTFSK